MRCQSARLATSAPRLCGLAGLSALTAATLLLAACGSGGISGSSPWRSLGSPGLTSFAFTSATRGWGLTFGSPGVMATSNGGRSWQSCTGTIVGAPRQGAGALPSTIDQLKQPLQVICADADVFVAYDDRPPLGGGLASQPATSRSGVLVSGDGGASWRPCLTLAASQDVVLYLSAASTSDLWALCRSDASGTTMPRSGPTFLLRTSDGGRHWARLRANDLGVAGLPGNLAEPLVFVSATQGWSTWNDAPAPLLRVTDNGGQTWSTPAQVEYVPVGFDALDANHAWTATGMPHRGAQVSGLYSTDNGARTWASDPAFAGVSLAAVYFANSSHGWVVAAGGGDAKTQGIYATTDGGAHWARELVPSSASWPSEGWQFCRAGDSLFVGSQTVAFSRPLPTSVH